MQLALVAFFTSVSLISPRRVVRLECQFNDGRCAGVVGRMHAQEGSPYASRCDCTLDGQTDVRRADLVQQPLARSSPEGDVLVVTRLDRLARSTRDLLNVLDEISKRGAGFKSLKDKLGRHHHAAWPPDAHGARRARRVRA